MSDLFKTLRLALYVVALPLAVTAVVSAESLLTVQDGIISDTDMEVSTSTAPAALDAAHGQVNHVLHIDAAGGVSGQIMNRGEAGFYGASGMDVTLNRQGRVVASSTTGSDGVFRFDNVPAGAYSFIATSESNITTFGVYVFEGAGPADNEVQFSVAATDSNTSRVRDILNDDVKSVSYKYLPEESEVVVSSVASQVVQNPDGSVNGRITPLLWEDAGQTFDLTGNRVFLLDNSGEVASANVDADGRYVLPNVPAGVYDFVSFGPHGAAALSVQVMANDSVATDSSVTQFASNAQVETIATPGFDCVLCEPTTGGLVNAETVDVVVDLPQQMGGCCDNGYGGGYGGGGGGGGFGGGFGDFGGLLGLALGAWVLSEAFDNNNNNAQVVQPPIVLPPVVIPPPTSPF